MAGQGQIPKIDGDILYSSDYNKTLNFTASQLIKNALSLPREYLVTGLSIIGSTNVNNQNGTLLFTNSGNTNYLNPIDPFTQSPLGSLWWSGAADWTRVGITTGGGSLFFNNSFDLSSTNSNGSLVTSGISTALNIFDKFGGNIRIQVGSFGFPANNISTSNIIVKVGGTEVLADNSVTNHVIASGVIDLMRTQSGTFWHRMASGTSTYNDWSSANVGDGMLTIYLNGTKSVSLGIQLISLLSIKALSGTNTCEFILAGSTPGNYFSGVSNNAVLLDGNWFGNFNSGAATHRYSFNSGINYNTGSTATFVNVPNS